MRSLEPLPIVPLNFFTEIAGAKYGPRRGRLKLLLARIDVAYRTYQIDDLLGLRPSPMTETEAGDLRHCYKVDTAPMLRLREDLARLARQICPYCGIDTPETIDHYLPEERYPEFAAYTPNLVPCCAICNGRKSTTVGDGTGRVFLHAFFDRVPPDALCLHADIRWQRDHPYFTFRLVQHPAISDDLFRIVREHARRLGLCEWYGKKAGEEFDYGDLLESCPSPAALAAQAAKHAVRKWRREGPLSWRAALWHAVSGNQAVVDYLWNRIHVHGGILGE